ncbi:MAG: histidine phosphatase family protein, partial [Actinobacteria bacterium]
MAVVRLVRHGRAAAGWDTDPDPGLDDLGVAQARAVGLDLLQADAPVVLSSPLRRCRETSSYYAGLARAEVEIEPAVSEIPAPVGIEMAGRADWLRRVMVGVWSELDDRYENYRAGVVERIRMCDQDTIIFSHFVAINAVIGAAIHDDRLVIRR